MDISPIKLCIFDLNGTLTNTPFIDHKPLHALPGRRARLDALRNEGKRLIVASNQSPPLWRLATGDPKYASVGELTYALYGALVELGIARSLFHAHGYSDEVILSLYDKRAVSIINTTVYQEHVAASGIAMPSAYMDNPPIVEKTQVLLHRLKDDFHAAIGGRFNAWISVDEDFRKPAPGMLTFAIHLSGVTSADTLFVGDMDDDKQAAEAAGVAFAWANDFFAEEHP